MKIMDWIDANYGLIVISVIVIAIIGYNYYKKHKQKKQDRIEQSYIDSEPIGMELFEDVQAKDTLSSLKKQKLNAEKNLRQIKVEAKKVVGQESQIDYEYRQRKIQFSNEKKRLGLNYTNYMHQSRIIDEMIQNQIRMQEEFKKNGN